MCGAGGEIRRWARKKGRAQWGPKKGPRRGRAGLPRRYTAELANWIGPERDIPAPDVGTGEQTMAWVMDTYAMHVGQATTAGGAGQPVELGGLRGGRGATGCGGMVWCGKIGRGAGRGRGEILGVGGS